MLNDHRAPATTTPSTEDEYFACFRSIRPELLGNDMPRVVEQIAQDAALAVRNVSSADADALTAFFPYLLCGEESAVHVFFREGRRVRKQNIAAHQLMLRVASEEKVHEAMLVRLSSELPEPKTLASARRQGHDFYIALAHSDPGVHFARIAALDSCVCKIMAALCSAPSVQRVPAVHRVFSKVRHDEATHVRISRAYVVDLGLPKDLLNSEADMICPALADFIQPTGEAFEYLGIDPDRMFRRIRREEV